MAVQRKKTTKLSGQAVMGEIKTLAMLTGGVVIGSVGGKMIDKVLNVDATATGFNVKAMARPIVLLGVGAAGNLMLKDPNMKMLATGVGAAGMLSGVKVFLKKDLLAGLSDFNMSGIDGLGEPAVYREPMNLSIERTTQTCQRFHLQLHSILKTMQATWKELLRKTFHTSKSFN